MKQYRHRSQHSGGKRRLIISFVLVLFVAAAGATNYLRPLPAVTVAQPALGSSSADAVNLNWPLGGGAAIGAQGFGLLASHGANTPLPTASVAKIIASLAILAQKPLTLGQQGPGLTISANDVAIYQKYAAEDGSLVPVTVGEQLTEYEMLQAMLLPSANNIADSAAIWTFGSLPNYVTYANQMLERLGLTHTTVADDASGFLPDTTSTASDLVKLGEIALQNPVISQIVAQSQADLPVAGTVHNVNVLLGQNGIIGLKTGNSDQAGGVFLFAATYTPVPSRSVTIVGAVIGAPDLGTAMHDSLSLLASAHADFSDHTFAHTGQVIGTYDIPWSKPINAVTSEDVSTIVWSGIPVQPTVKLDHINHAVAANTAVGSISVHAGNTVTSHQLVLQKAIPSPSWSWRLFRNPF